MDSFFGELIKLGAAGLVIWVIAAPLIKYLIDRSKEQDQRITDLIDNHLVQDAERHVKNLASLEHVEHGLAQVEKVLSRLPETMLDRVSKIYPPVPPGNTTVNVAQPGPVTTQTTPAVSES